MIIRILNRKERLLEKYPEELLFELYAGISKGKVLCPFHKERTPSLHITGKSFKCFGCGANGDAIEFIKLLYNTDFIGALDIIEKQRTVVKTRPKIIEREEENNITWKISEWRDKHINYWSEYNVDINILSKYNVYPLSLVKKGQGVIYNDYKDNLAFLYRFRRGWKIYIPKVSFLSNGALIQGIENIRFNDTLIITKAYKDVMMFSSIGYNSIAPGSENIYISRKIMEYLIRKFKRVIINFDNDEAGKRARDKYVKEYEGLSFIECPYYKDFTDMCKSMGIKETETTIKQLINYES